MINDESIIALRMERQCLTTKVTQRTEYDALFRDLQPGQNLYWNGFGDPPSLKHRAAFDDTEYNRERQNKHQLLKVRLIGGNLGWIIPEDLELFAALYRKPLSKPNRAQLQLLELIECGEPMNIHQMKEETGMLTKVITPALHRLQEAFLIYEDQYDGEWDRGWYPFTQMFPCANLSKYTRHEALKIILQRFAYRIVWFDSAMAESYYKLPKKEINTALKDLVAEYVLVECNGGYLLKADEIVLQKAQGVSKSVLAIHKNDFLYRAYEYMLKNKWKREKWETLYYLLIDGEFHGAAYGKFRYGPPDFDDVVLDLSNQEADNRKDEIIDAVKILSCGKAPEKYNGERY